jgi:hypothetical protein
MDADDPTGEPQERERPPGPNPYKGLLQFEEADADRFFGRERLAGDLYARLSAVAEASEERLRLLAVLGPSGSGKSSLVRAGLWPLLVLERYAWRILTLSPRPIEALARELARSEQQRPIFRAKRTNFEQCCLIPAASTRCPGSMTSCRR